MGHPQGDMHMVAARVGCKSAMVGTSWANSLIVLTVRIQDFSSKFSGLDNRLLNLKQKSYQSVFVMN